MQSNLPSGDEISYSSNKTRLRAPKPEEALSWQEGLMPFVVGDVRKMGISLWKLNCLILVSILVSLILILRLFDLQVIQGKKFLVLGESNRILIQTLPSPRGIIYDRNGEILARNIPSFRASLNLSQLPILPEARQKVLQKTQEILGLTNEQLQEKLALAKDSPFLTITLKPRLSYNEQLQLNSLDQELAGIFVEEDIQRVYPKGENFSHSIGFIGFLNKDELQDPQFANYHLDDSIGREGVEKVYEQYLKGKNGQRLVEVDATGRVQRTVSERKPQAGNNLILSLDAKLQQRVGEILEKALRKYAATGGAVIVQQVTTGKIMSLNSLPSYDNNLFAVGIKGEEYQALINDPSVPLVNRTTLGEYPPGSTVKPIVAAAALQEGIITPTTQISDSPQVIKIGPWEFPDWTVAWGGRPHGNINVLGALAESCDIFFYKIGGGYSSGIGGGKDVTGLGVDKLKDYFTRFGLGQLTGIDTPTEALGLVPDPDWKRETKNESWFLGNTYHISIGQGDLLATPLQVINFITSIANGGELLKPQLLSRIENAQGEIMFENQPQVLAKDLVGEKHLQTVKKGLRLAVTDGIIYPLRGAKTSVAAKTGTAEFGTKNAKGEYQTHAWVTGFFPYEEPKYAFVILLESGGKSSNAAEVARELVDWMVDSGF